MPLYEYIDPEKCTSVEIMRSVEDRNKPLVIDGHTYKRSTFIPTRVIIFGSHPTKDQSFDKKILQGYYRKEQQEGSRFRSGYTKKQLAKVYAEAKTL